MKDIDRFWGETSVSIECDNCGESSYASGENLQECMDQFKEEEGWCFKLIGDHWHDFCCQACRNEYLRNTPYDDFR